MATTIVSHSAGAVAADQSGEFVRAHISRVPYLPGLDGMRALAVIAVMIYHANDSWLPGGFLGVEMFFVISGYLITLLLIAERERTYRISLTQFWMRRARRLLPALFMMMGLLTIWTALFERDALGQLRGDVTAGFFYVSNWYQIWVGLGYTSSGDFAPLRHLWSLAVEEQFYLIWPLLMVVFLRRSGTRRVANISRWLFLAAVVITVLVGLAFHPGPAVDATQNPEGFWWLGDRPISKLDMLYLSTIGRAGGLLLGSAFAMVWRPYAVVRGPLREKGRRFDVVAAFALVGFGWMCWQIHLAGPGGADVRLFRGGLFVAGLLTLLIIAAVAHQEARSNTLLGNRLFVWIGVRSYGLYLYHWPIYQIIRKVAGNRLTVIEFVWAMVATFIITDLSYRFVETPIRRGRLRANLRFVRSNAQAKATLITATAVVAALSMFAGASLATAELKQNDIAESLGDGEQATTNLADAAADEIDAAAAATAATADPETADPDEPKPVLVSLPATTEPLFAPEPTTAALPAPESTVAPSAATTVAGDPATAGTDTTVAPIVVPATTTPPPPTSLPPAPVTQLGIVDDLATITPLSVPVVTSGLPLVALGDSVMLGAAEELTARGFVVDAVKSRQLVSFLPELEPVVASGALTSVVVVHLGTNGPVSDQSLGSLMALLANVPIVVLLTGKGDRDWIGGNNAKIRALPGVHPNVTVLDWETLSAQCPGRCFYDDGIHLTQTGQDYYTELVRLVLGLP
jgi:peptidoglycan/LPS O-acetylase OafA/YrhL